MKTYKYLGKNRSAAAGMALVPNEVVTLWEGDMHVCSLVAKGLLVEVETQPAAKNTNEQKKTK
ncbi:MAG: hypothetical protein QM642_01850 [Edaphocola sp.]